ncbi:unnamed protein product (macronuclear) [Paramecium tetraurelia]|uniref:non-specific serine/threonine protein kinase n=1 Tax=Paramecium tetraurelia TaxID=5888 RepID=A0DH19_PARTE|nr:uncharacterized protein GSPATT00002465001 [Paramecium tetraurelia]CAK82336.1 unnamed protein product [Paramecium tetraurelia]|eukprot:XP_001449733.1 hypothetical protein (macronuclear) [Paramecium tetraurelia strain d4-2]
MENYLISRLIGKGNFGQGLQGKTLKKQFDCSSQIYKQEKEVRERFRNLRQVLRRLIHENIILLLDVFKIQVNFCLFTENNVQFGQGEIFEIWNDATYNKLKLDTQHNNQILHREMKPYNILISADEGNCKNTRAIHSIKATSLYTTPKLIQEQSYDHTVDMKFGSHTLLNICWKTLLNGLVKRSLTPTLESKIILKIILMYLQKICPFMMSFGLVVNKIPMMIKVLLNQDVSLNFWINYHLKIYNYQVEQQNLIKISSLGILLQFIRIKKDFQTSQEILNQSLISQKPQFQFTTMLILVQQFKNKSYQYEINLLQVISILITMFKTILLYLYRQSDCTLRAKVCKLIGKDQIPLIQ